MATDALYDFRPATLADLDLLRGWQATPEVSRWWGTEDVFDAGDLVDTQFRPFILSLDGRSFAYLQDYAVHAWPNHHFAHLPDKARGIDLFIGEPDLIGKGHGPAFIRQHVRRLFAEGAPVVATDPHPDNHRAIAGYIKAGFRVSGEPRPSDWGLILPMEAWQDPELPSGKRPRSSR